MDSSQLLDVSPQKKDSSPMANIAISQFPLNTISVLLLHLLHDNSSDFFQNLFGMFSKWSSCAYSNLVQVHQQIWPPLVILDFSRYQISFVTSGRILPILCISDSYQPLDASPRK